MIPSRSPWTVKPDQIVIVVIYVVINYVVVIYVIYVFNIIDHVGVGVIIVIVIVVVVIAKVIFVYFALQDRSTEF